MTLKTKLHVLHLISQVLLFIKRTTTYKKNLIFITFLLFSLLFPKSINQNSLSVIASIGVLNYFMKRIIGNIQIFN